MKGNTERTGVIGRYRDREIDKKGKDKETDRKRNKKGEREKQGHQKSTGAKERYSRRRYLYTQHLY